MIIEQWKNRIEHCAPNVLKVDIAAVRARIPKLFTEAGRTMRDYGINAYGFEILKFFIGARYSDHPAAVNPAELAYHLADPTGCRRPHYGVSRLRFTLHY